MAFHQIERTANFLKRSGQSQTAVQYFHYLLAREHRPLAMARQVLLCLEATDDTRGLRNTLAEFAPLTNSNACSQALALHRTCRRLARKVKMGWAPLPTLRTPATRVLRLPTDTFSSETTPRPMYATPQGPQTIEQAVVAWLTTVGRTAFVAENHLWSTVFGLLFRNQLFAPIPGALPTRRLSGPQDLHSPQFYAKRKTGVDQILGQIIDGQAPELLAAAHGGIGGPI